MKKNTCIIVAARRQKIYLLTDLGLEGNILLQQIFNTYRLRSGIDSNISSELSIVTCFFAYGTQIFGSTECGEFLGNNVSCYLTVLYLTSTGWSTDGVESIWPTW